MLLPLLCGPKSSAKTIRSTWFKCSRKLYYSPEIITRKVVFKTFLNQLLIFELVWKIVRIHSQKIYETNSRPYIGVPFRCKPFTVSPHMRYVCCQSWKARSHIAAICIIKDEWNIKDITQWSPPRSRSGGSIRAQGSVERAVMCLTLQRFTYRGMS